MNKWEEMAKIIKQLIELSTDREWDVKAIVELRDCCFEYKCSDETIQDYVRASRYIEDRDWQRTKNHNKKWSENQLIQQWALQIAYEMHGYYMRKRWDCAKKVMGID